VAERAVRPESEIAPLQPLPRPVRMGLTFRLRFKRAAVPVVPPAESAQTAAASPHSGGLG
jgi:hypothetical protein